MIPVIQQQTSDGQNTAQGLGGVGGYRSHNIPGGGGRMPRNSTSGPENSHNGGGQNQRGGT